MQQALHNPVACNDVAHAGCNLPVPRCAPIGHPILEHCTHSSRRATKCRSHGLLKLARTPTARAPATNVCPVARSAAGNEDGCWP